MPIINCKYEGCKLSISYPSDATTILHSVTTFTEEKKSSNENADSKKGTWILTLECRDAHRYNYEVPTTK